ncbi:acyl-CoA dehydrogenase family protein [Desertimonas flava]|uniref:acyl-CoA dehydrogenase family protein n=1 Tax=Desertimonas flava TaxID=2064846 RepID=UPI000E34230F|nr:acyl-CoA dehydrogenase family protein [Desertimonas flava]
MSTTTTLSNSITRPADLASWAEELGKIAGAAAARHDQDGSWIDDSFDALRSRGYLALAVPSELGGMGATLSEIAGVQRILGRHCGSTALAMSMHQHVTAFTAWRYRRDLAGAEATLRRVADEGIVLVSTGGADFTNPRGTATKVDGGYMVSGHKIFASQSPAGTVMSTMFAYDDPEQGLRVLNLAVPFSDPGVTVLDNWNTMGMRGTASHDVVVENVFVPGERVLANRPHGVIDPPLQVILSIAFSVINGAYLGVADSAAAAAIDAVADRAGDPGVQRQVGLMQHRLRVASWAHEGALAAVGDDPQPSMETVAAVMAAKREIAIAGIEVCDIAMELAGGRAYFKGSPIERAYRDIRAAKFHPLTPEATLLHGGRLALGQPCDIV